MPPLHCNRNGWSHINSAKMENFWSAFTFHSCGAHSPQTKPYYFTNNNSSPGSFPAIISFFLHPDCGKFAKCALIRSRKNLCFTVMSSYFLINAWLGGSQRAFVVPVEFSERSCSLVVETYVMSSVGKSDRRKRAWRHVLCFVRACVCVFLLYTSTSTTATHTQSAFPSYASYIDAFRPLGCLGCR